MEAIDNPEAWLRAAKYFFEEMEKELEKQKRELELQMEKRELELQVKELELEKERRGRQEAVRMFLNCQGLLHMRGILGEC